MTADANLREATPRDLLSPPLTACFLPNVANLDPVSSCGKERKDQLPKLIVDVKSQC